MIPRRSFLGTSILIGAAAAARAGEPEQPPTRPGVPDADRRVFPGTVAVLPEIIVGVPFWVQWVISSNALEARGPQISNQSLRLSGFELDLVEAATLRPLYAQRSTSDGLAGRAALPFTKVPKPPATLAVMGRVRWRPDAEFPGSTPCELRIRLLEPPWGAASTTVRVRPPTPVEAEAIRRLAPLDDYPERLPTVRGGVLPPVPEPAALAEVPPSLRDALGMDLELRRLFMGPVPDPVMLRVEDFGYQRNPWESMVVKAQMRQIDALAIGRGLPEFYRPLLGLLQYEVWVAQGEFEYARRVRDAVLAELPGLDWMFAHLDRGDDWGLISFHRQRLATYQGTRDGRLTVRPATRPAAGGN
jgi:hypothetical protein